MRARVLCFATILSGCYSYTRVDTVAPPRNAEVVATLSMPVDVRVHEVTVHEVTFVEGRVAYADADSLVLSGRRFLSAGGTEYASLGSPVTILRSSIGELRHKRVSAWKTALALGAGGGAIAAIVASVGPLAGTGSGGGPPKPPASVHAPR
jgi:hypothetical protein